MIEVVVGIGLFAFVGACLFLIYIADNMEEK